MDVRYIGFVAAIYVSSLAPGLAVYIYPLTRAN